MPQSRLGERNPRLGDPARNCVRLEYHTTSKISVSATTSRTSCLAERLILSAKRPVPTMTEYDLLEQLLKQSTRCLIRKY